MEPITLSAVRRLLVGASAFLATGGALLGGAYTGPVPWPTDAYGQPGPFAVQVRTFPSPGFSGQVVTVFVPQDATGPRPTWFFAHGFGGFEAEYYRELLQHWASHGWTVVFSPYPPGGTMPANYDIIDAGFVAAAANYPDAIDTRKVGFGGHSYGAGATPAMALRAIRERGWGQDARCLLLLAPWYSDEVSTSDLQSFPTGTQAVVQIYEDDLINDHRMAIDLFRRLNLPAADKDFLLLRSGWIEGHGYSADHTVPVSGTLPNAVRPFDALDTWGVLRIAQALAASCFDGDPAAREIALGGGAAVQTEMGASASGRALRLMVVTDEPYALFPQSRYDWPFSGLLNPRRAEPPAEAPTATTRLTNVSARARSEDGGNVLIVGAAVEGSRPKSILIRGAGPALVPQGVADAMADPRLATFAGPLADLANDDWSSAHNVDVLRVTAAAVGAFDFPEPGDDAAVLGSFSTGGVTAHAQIESGPAGVALIELYEADLEPASRLVNLSARARVGTGEDILVAGFVIEGSGLLRVLVRGVGPGLAALGVDGALADPVLTLHQGSQVLASNDTWWNQPDAASIASVASQVGAFELPGDSEDACLLLHLPPGDYTAQVSGADGGTGVALAEIYAVP